MKRNFIKTLALVLTLLFVATFAFAGSQGEEEGSIVVGHLSYHTGPFADVGPWFDGITDFALSVINEDPPLGRELVAVHQDIGTIGEAQAARKLIEQDGTVILLNAAHEYLSYRDWLLGYMEDNDSPLMPTVHGGGIMREIGGLTTEPIFRGAPMDSGQAVAAVIKARDEGARRVVLLATEIEGSQLQMEAAIKVAEAVGLNVVDEINVVPEQPSYRTEVTRIANANPDTLICFSQAQDGATIVKQTAEAGLSLNVIGTTEWMGEAFPETATQASFDQHKNIWISGFSYRPSAAFDEYAARLAAFPKADVIGDPANSYNIEYYDLLVVTALAIEQCGSLKASEWAPAMFSVANPPGRKVRTYEEGLAAVRAGEEVDYSGLTGEFDYTETAVVSGLFGIFTWEGMSLVQVDTIDDVEVLELDSL